MLNALLRQEKQQELDYDGSKESLTELKLMRQSIADLVEINARTADGTEKAAEALESSNGPSIYAGR